MKTTQKNDRVIFFMNLKDDAILLVELFCESLRDEFKEVEFDYSIKKDGEFYVVSHRNMMRNWTESYRIESQINDVCFRFDKTDFIARNRKNIIECLTEIYESQKMKAMRGL